MMRPFAAPARAARRLTLEVRPVWVVLRTLRRIKFGIGADRDRWSAVLWAEYWMGSPTGCMSDFLLKIADHDVERATGEQIRRSIVVARLGKLPVSSSAGEIGKGQRSSEHDKGENNDQRSAFRCAIMRMQEYW